MSENIKFLDETFNNWPNDLLGTNVYKSLESCCELLLIILQCINRASEISKWDIFPTFLSLFILLLVLSKNFIVSGIKSSR